MGRDGAGCPPSRIGLAVLLGLDSECVGLGWAAAVVLLTSEMGPQTPGMGTPTLKEVHQGACGPETHLCSPAGQIKEVLGAPGTKAC